MAEKQYDNNNRGVLFKNDQQGNPKRPNYRGSITVDTKEYNISGWVRESQKSGDKFLSLSIEEKGSRYKSALKQQEVPAFVDDDLPPF